MDQSTGKDSRAQQSWWVDGTETRIYGGWGGKFERWYSLEEELWKEGEQESFKHYLEYEEYWKYNSRVKCYHTGPRTCDISPN